MFASSFCGQTRMFASQGNPFCTTADASSAEYDSERGPPPCPYCGYEYEAVLDILEYAFVFDEHLEVVLSCIVCWRSQPSEVHERIEPLHVKDSPPCGTPWLYRRLPQSPSAVAVAVACAATQKDSASQ